MSFFRSFQSWYIYQYLQSCLILKSDHLSITKMSKKKFTSDFYKWRSTLAMAKLDLRLANGNILLKRLSSYVDWHLISCNWNWFRPKLYLLFHFLLNQLKQKKEKKERKQQFDMRFFLWRKNDYLFFPKSLKANTLFC